MKSFLKKITKKTLLISILTTLTSLQVMAYKTDSISDRKPMPNIIKISPLTLLKGQIPMIHYERVIYKNLTASLGITPILFGPLIGTLAFPPDKFKGGIAIDPELRWYAQSDKVMDGFYFGFYNSIRSSKWESLFSSKDVIKNKLSTPDLKVSSTKVIGGIHIGTQKLMGKHFTVDVNGGTGLSKSKTVAKKSASNQFYDQAVGASVNFKFDIALGWRF
jgi:hypothetical protein